MRAILIVSFGTTFEDTRRKTIDVLEKRIASEFADYKIYRAWTSKMIIEKIKKRDHIKIPTVTEAFKQMSEDGITEVIVQPTHVINGVENDLMKQDANRFLNQMERIVFGEPLISSEEDGQICVDMIADAFSYLNKQEEYLVLMGHGTTHYVNTVYAAMDYKFKEQGHENIYVGTVEAYPEIDTLVKIINQKKPKKIILTPFMIVAGDHARNDMAGAEDSWKSKFEHEGYVVECVVRGLGEYEKVQELLVAHTRSAVAEMEA